MIKSYCYSKRNNKTVIARSEATCLRAEALRRASVAILWDCFTSFARTPFGCYLVYGVHYNC
jgi:hypothetical protein